MPGVRETRNNVIWTAVFNYQENLFFKSTPLSSNQTDASSPQRICAEVRIRYKPAGTNGSSR
jgi:hypothetical protein